MSTELLTALYERGGVCLTDDSLAFMQVEVRDLRLIVTGRTPFRDDGEQFISAGTEYRYVLETEAAEELLRVLSVSYPGRPEGGLFQEFEFDRDCCTLAAFLDSLGLPYHYEKAEGGLSDL